MIIDVPFEYFCFLAFKVNLQFENKRMISFRRFSKYIDALVFRTLEDYRNNGEIFVKENWKGPVDIRRMDYYDELMEVVDKSGGMFSFDGDMLELSQDVTLDDLIDLVEVADVSHRFIYMSDCTECLDALGATTIKNSIANWVKIEKEFFDEYMKLVYTSRERASRNKINKFLLNRMMLTSQINSFDKERVWAFYTCSGNMTELELDTRYDIFPINVKFYKNSPCYEINNDLVNLLKTDFQYAIFGSKSIVEECVINILGNIYDAKWEKIVQLHEQRVLDDCDDEQIIDEGYMLDVDENPDCSSDYSQEDEDTEEIIPDHPWEDLVFYLVFVDKINSFFRDYGYTEELEVAKYRLLYLLDRPDWCLYDKDSFEEVLEQVLECGYLEENIANIFEMEAKYFITEVFENINGDNEILTIKKLLFVSSYWELTHDKEIKEILNAYRGNENYMLFSQIILGEDVGYTKTL